jgi:glycosyltransferase involved in cell wall biosynthesis
MDLLGAPLVRSLRIALVTEVADTGLGLLLESLAQGLAVRGHHVHLIYSDKRADPNIIARLRQSGVTLKAIAMRRRPGMADFAAVWRLRRYLLETGPFDIIHGHSSKGGAVARLAGIGLEGAKLYTPHAFYTLASNLKAIERALYAIAERRLSRLCQRLIVSSRTEFDHARRLGITAEKLAIVPNGITPGDLGPPQREELGVPANACLVGFVGRLEPQRRPISRSKPLPGRISAIQISAWRCWATAPCAGCWRRKR